MITCAHCQTENPDAAKFCLSCGQKLALSCPNCGTELPANVRFCFNCGHRMAASAPQEAVEKTPVTTPAAPVTDTNLDRFIPANLLKQLQLARDSAEMVGERRIVTMLFCDVKGSTAAAATLDPEEWAGIINGAFEHMIAPIYRYEGTVARLMGDGILAFFGAPLAHEDDPQRAVLAGLGIIDSLQPYREQVMDNWGIDVNVRVGINTGLVVVGAVGSDLRMEYSALGDAINMAARMENAAAPGTLLIAEPTYKLVVPLFDVEVIENLDLKGRAEPVTAYRVTGSTNRPHSLRGIKGLNSPMIGRDAELAHLMEAIEATARGRGQIVAVMAEAGLGKSRLVQEARDRSATSGAGLRWIDGRSLSYETDTPYAPIRGLLSTFFDFPDDAGPTDRYARMKQLLGALFPARAGEMASILAQPLALPVATEDKEWIAYLQPPQIRQKLFFAMAALLKEVTIAQPLAMVVDDIHWIDPTSLALLESLLPLTEQAALLIIILFRPRREDPSWTLHETAGRDYGHRYTSLALRPLEDDQARLLIRNLLAVEGLPESLRQLMLDKSEGNPFFLEEVIRSLLDADLVVNQDGRWVATADIAGLAVPDTLNGVITARLDRLDDEARTVAQAAAVLGREFAYPVLGDMPGAGKSLDNSLNLLLKRELIRESSRVPWKRYKFKHALTQDAAYNSLLLSRRRQLHLAAAEALERHVSDEAAEIARHFLAAKQPGHAVPYLVTAGEQAYRSFAVQEAIHLFSQAIQYKELTEPSVVWRAYEGLGAAVGGAQGPVKSIEVYQEMLATAESLGNSAMQISALNKIGLTTAMQMGQLEAADESLVRAEELSREHDDKNGYAELSIIRCMICTQKADFDSVISYLGELVEIAEETDNPAFKAMGLDHIGSSQMYLTRFDEAYNTATEGLKIAREIGDREHEATLLATVLPFYYVREGELDQALAVAREGIAIAERISTSYPVALGNWLIAEILRSRGEYEQALAAGQRSLEAALPFEQMMPFLTVIPLGSLGMIYLDLSERFTDRIAEFHHHAIRLLETPAAAAGGASAWADLGWCTMQLNDLDAAAEAFEKGLNTPSIAMHIERPRHLAGYALLQLRNGNSTAARRLAEEAMEYVLERKMQNLYPLVYLTRGQVLAQDGEHEAAVDDFARALKPAEQMGMRPIIWQIEQAMAVSLLALGREDEAASHRTAAEQMTELIAAGITDPELRTAYRRQQGLPPRT